MELHASLGFFFLILIFFVGLGAGFGINFIAYYSPLQARYHNLNQANLALSNYTSQLSKEISTLQTQSSSLNSSYQQLQARYASLQSQLESLRSLASKGAAQEGALGRFYEWSALGIPPVLQAWYSQALSLTPGGGKTGFTQSALSDAVILAAIDTGQDSWAASRSAFTGLGTYSSDYKLFSNISSWTEPIIQAFSENVLQVPVNMRFGNSSVPLGAVLNYTSTLSSSSAVNGSLLSPVETMVRGSGNQLDVCEVAASLLSYNGFNVSLALVKVNSSSTKAVAMGQSPPVVYSFMVLVQLPNLKGTRYYSNLTAFGIQGGKWALIDPGLPLSQQNTASPATQYTLLGVQELPRVG